MKQKFKVLLLLLVPLTMFGQHQYNTFKPGELWLDNNGIHINAHGGGILFQKGKYYWYGEHKTKGEEGNLANVGIHCYSSKDLYNWKDEGIVLRVMDQGTGSDIEKGCIMERPKVIFNSKTNKYVMWFHLEPKGMGYKGAMSGVAVADTPIGPFKYLKALRPNAGHWPINVNERNKNGIWDGQNYSGGDLPLHPDSLNILGRDFENGQMARDMTLFVDEDSKAYHIYSSEENSTLHISELSDDYLSCTGKFKRLFSGRFMEAPAMFKKDGKYYLMMSGCTGWSPNTARSAVADSIWGEWSELGNPCIGDDAVTTFRSQSTYIFPIQGKEGKFIYMGDRWMPNNAIDGRYIWLPIKFENERFTTEWESEWKIK